MSFLKKLFPAKQIQEAPPHPNEMPIEEVWEEFKRIVPYRGGGKLIKMLEKPGFAPTLNWLKPPTNCPMAKSVMRSMVDYYRNPSEPLTDMALVYQAESEEKWTVPPQSSLDGVSGIVTLMQIPASVFYRPTPDAEWRKDVISPA